MNPLELITALLAPHLCLVCKKESTPLCQNCAKNCFEVPKSSCYRCRSPADNFATCLPCSIEASINHLWIGSQYDGIAKEIVACLKFQRIKVAANVIAQRLDGRLPVLSERVVIVPVPTAGKRIRVRGYDQAELIAKALARRRGLVYRNVLRRVSSTRQVGSGRQQRFIQLKGAFTVRHPEKIQGRHILIVDDVLTTGATLESAARVLKKAGVAYIDAAVFAH